MAKMMGLVDELEEEAKDVFKIFDNHGKGTISADDLRDVLSDIHDLNQKQINALINEADPDNDGLINFGGKLILKYPHTK